MRDDGRAAGAPAAVPVRRRRAVVLPEARSRPAPEWLETTTVATPNGTTSRALVAADLAHVVWAVNLGCLGFHVWPYLAADAEHADELRIDLDPQPGTDFTHVRAAAAEAEGAARRARHRRLPEDDGQPRAPRLRAPRAALGLVPGARRRRGRRARARAPATRPHHRRSGGRRSAASASSSTSTRTRRTRRCSAPGAVRARPGAQVSTPLRWDEIDAIHPDELTIASLPARIEADGDPWAGMNDDPQSLEPLLEMHERDRADGLMDAPWPPVYPKQPDEPPRVSRSRAKKT